jgi:4-amino-4-deoxy-L-arabinose transferase-like glycosyltransferase
MNARFLAETGRDEWQQPWPLVFRSFGDAKLVGYIYTVMGVGRLIGWQMLAVRLPSFLAGIGIVVLVYLVAKLWWHDERVSQLSVLLLLISPWSWHYSSIGFEAHLGLMLFLFSLYLWLGRHSWRRDGLATIALVAAILTYNAPLLITPWLFIVLWQQRGWQRDFWRGAIMLVVAIVGAGWLTLAASTQKGSISIFQDPTLTAFYPAYRAAFAGISQKLLGNRAVYYGWQMIKNLVNSFSWDFLVQKGGTNPWHGIPSTGHFSLVLWLMLPAAIGAGGRQLWIGWRAHRRATWSLALTILTGVVISLTPALITVDAPHATRSLFFFVIATLAAAAIMGHCWRWWPRWTRWLIGITMFISWLVWWLPAPMHWQTSVNARWQVGLMSTLTSPIVQQAPSVLIHDENGMLYPYVVLASQMSASDFWQTAHRSLPDTVGLVRVERVGKYRFWPTNDQQSAVYVVPTSPTKWVTIKKDI